MALSGSVNDAVNATGSRRPGLPGAGAARPPAGRTFGGAPNTSNSDRSMKSFPENPGPSRSGESSVMRIDFTPVPLAVGAMRLSRLRLASVNVVWRAGWKTPSGPAVSTRMSFVDALAPSRHVFVGLMPNVVTSTVAGSVTTTNGGSVPRPAGRFGLCGLNADHPAPWDWSIAASGPQPNGVPVRSFEPA